MKNNNLTDSEMIAKQESEENMADNVFDEMFGPFDEDDTEEEPEYEGMFDEEERKMMLEARELLMADVDPYPDPEVEFEEYKEKVMREAYEEMLREDAAETMEDEDNEE